MPHVTISGFSCDPVSGHVISAPISGHIDTNIDTDIGYSPISGHSVTDIVHYIPDIGVNIGTNIGMPDIGNCNNPYRCQYRTQYRVSRYRGSRTSDIVINIGHDIGLQTASVLPWGWDHHYSKNLLMLCPLLACLQLCGASAARRNAQTRIYSTE